MGGGWTGYESAYGPFTLADGLYYVWWNPDATYLGEQSYIATDADGVQLGAGEYGTGAVNCFEVGASDVDCPAAAIADLTFPDADGDGVVDGATYDLDRTFYDSNPKHWYCVIKLLLYNGSYSLSRFN